MAAALRRLSLESAVLGALTATIVAVACSSSWSPGLRGVANPLRALGILALCAFALVYAARRNGSLRRAKPAFLCAAGFLTLAAVSFAWSVDPGKTLLKSGALALLIAGAAALGAAAATDRRMSRRVLLAVLAGAALVALAGLAIYAVSPGDAVQPATSGIGERFRGLGQNPNTVAMLFAVALPLAALVVLEARTARERLAGGAASLLLAGSIAVSGSRGALVGACVGLLAFGLAAVRSRIGRAGVVGAVALFAVAAAAIGSIPDPLPAEAARASYPVGSTERYTPNDAEYVFRLEDEVRYSTGSGRFSGHGFLGGSGRIDAWRAALDQGAHRLALGYGFGTEEKVFVDRVREFQGGLPESSYVGLFLQLGAGGVAIFLALVAALAVAAARALRVDRGLAAACLGVLGAGLALALVQSYVYAVGNVATLAFWFCAFLPTVRTGE